MTSSHCNDDRLTCCSCLHALHAILLDHAPFLIGCASLAVWSHAPFLVVSLELLQELVAVGVAGGCELGAAGLQTELHSEGGHSTAVQHYTLQ